MPKKIIIPTVQRAIQLGHEAAAIEAALEQLKISHSNAGISYGGEVYSFHNHPLFLGLSQRREAIRAELLGKEY